MKALINTKSNYKGLNNQWLEVQEINGIRITCKVFFEEFQKYNNVDFTAKEVKSVKIFCGLFDKVYEVKQVCKISEMPKNSRFLTTTYNNGESFHIYRTDAGTLYAAKNTINN